MLLPALFWGLQPAVAQTDYSADEKAELERQNRKNLREAKEYKSDYKETHLNTATYQYKPGKAGRKAAKIKKRKDKASLFDKGLFKKRKK